MTIINNKKELIKTMISSIESFENVSFSVGCAKDGHELSDLLLKHYEKIKTSTIGLHFFKTDALFIKKFFDIKEVKFVLNEKGIFNPKIYFFYDNEKEWKLLIGSVDFTDSAFEHNEEIMIEINSADNKKNNIFFETKNTLENYFHNKNYLSKDILENYIGIHPVHRKKN